jgi:hypothetical protein
VRTEPDDVVVDDVAALATDPATGSARREALAGLDERHAG